MSEQSENGAMTGAADPGPPAPGSFADGYHQGREDVLSSLAAGHHWAVKAFEEAKDKQRKIDESNAKIDQERQRIHRERGCA